MKLLLDENLSPRLTELLSDLYPNSVHVHQLGLGAANDSDIWEYAKTHSLVIVTKDADFAERSVLASDPPKILWLRIGNCATGEIARLLRLHAEAVGVFLEYDTETCLLLGRG